MIKFSTFIKESVLVVEGGNLPFVDPNKPHEGARVSDSIDSSRRDKEAPEFKEMFHSIDKGFHEQHGHNLFGHALNNNTFASGSAEVYNDPKVSTDKFKRMKPTMGDYDVQVPKEHKDKLISYLKPGQVHGNFTVVHTTSGNQVHAIVRHNETGLHHQIDFEPVNYDEKKQEPTEFEKFAHNSHPDDLESGLKGVDHKFLLQSTLGAHSKPAIISTMKGRGKARAEHQEEGSYTPHTFSVDKGIREKWEKIGEKDGKPIVRERPSKGAEYSTDMHHIYRALFNREPSEQDVQDIHSFHGLVKHIKAHIPKEHHQKIFNRFTNKLWHSTAQERSVDPEIDRASKESAHAIMSKEFPDEAKASSEDTEKKKAEYYDPNGTKFKRGAKIPAEDAKNPDNLSESKDKEDFHVAIAAGRFTGPTKEHQKLLDNFFAQKADKHHVFVMGPESKEKTTLKDPLTVDEKIEQLKKLYPKQADSFVPGTHKHTKNPMKAITWAWHQHQKPGRNVHLTVIGGSGDAGIEKKSKAGGSLESYKGIVERYNGTRFPISENPDGSLRGGDIRMDYATTKFVENPRGDTSGSMMRKFATEHNHTNEDHVNQFMGMLHSGFVYEDACELMKKIKERASGVNESLYKTVLNILRESNKI